MLNCFYFQCRRKLPKPSSTSENLAYENELYFNADQQQVQQHRHGDRVGSTQSSLLGSGVSGNRLSRRNSLNEVRISQSLSNIQDQKTDPFSESQTEEQYTTVRKDSRAKLIVSKGARNKIGPGDGDTMMETSTTDSSTAPQLPDRGQRVTVETVTVKDNKEYDADLESEDKEDDGGSGVYWSISDFHKL